MNQKELHNAIKAIAQKLCEFKYPINDKRNDRVLKYNKTTGLWVFYFLDERGGRNTLRTFETEEEACAYII